MSIQTIATIGVIAFFALIILIVVLYVASDSFYERHEEKALRRSVKIRKEITDEVHEIRSRMKENNVDMESTEQTRLLGDTMRAIESLARDGRRPTDKIQSLAKKLPDLEKQALESVS